MINPLKNIYFRLLVLLLAVFKSTDLFERINKLSWYKKTLQQWIVDQHFPASSKVLEAGCATGALSAYLAQQDFNPTGLDFSRTMIERAKQHYPNIKFFEADVLDIPFKDNTFDIVLATSLVNIVDDKKQAIAELTRTCKKGGLLSLLVPCDQFTNEHLSEFLLTIGNKGFSAAALKTWHKSAPKMNEHELRSLLEQEALNNITTKHYLDGMVVSISGTKSM